jgi:hypothetical protein
MPPGPVREKPISTTLDPCLQLESFGEVRRELRRIREYIGPTGANGVT